MFSKQLLLAKVVNKEYEWNDVPVFSIWMPSIMIYYFGITFAAY